MDPADTTYSVLAPFYESWQKDSDPPLWADFADSVIRRLLKKKKGQGSSGRYLLADLGCGTGTLSALMAERGYDVIAIDSSPDMLTQAFERYGSGDISFVCQDISSMDLFGTVDAMICFMDTVNHITDRRKLRSFFRSCKNFLDPGGVLVFDIATEKHFSVTCGNNTFAEAEEDHAMIWNNRYIKAQALNKAEVSVFISCPDGSYSRYDTEIRERYYPPEEIMALLEEEKLSLKAVYADFKRKEPDKNSERIFFAAVNEYDPQKENL